MKKLITLENLTTFLQESRKIFALKTDVPTTSDVNSRLTEYAKSADVTAEIENGLKPYAKSADVTTEIENGLKPYAKSADVTAEIENGLKPYAKSADVTTEIENGLKPYAKSADLAAYAKKADITKAVHYRGSVDVYSSLPSVGVLVGDMYNVVRADPEHGIKAGDNVVYNGDGWDNLGGTIDLSAYATKVDVQRAVLGGIRTAQESDIKNIF